MVHTGVLKEYSASECALPCFTIAKNDGQVRQTSDLCSLNKYLKCKKKPCCIQDIMQHISGYKYFTKLYISMQF